MVKLQRKSVLFDSCFSGGVPLCIGVALATAGTKEEDTASPHVLQNALSFCHISINLQWQADITRRCRCFYIEPCIATSHMHICAQRLDPVAWQRAVANNLLAGQSLTKYVYKSVYTNDRHLLSSQCSMQHTSYKSLSTTSSF